MIRNLDTFLEQLGVELYNSPETYKQVVYELEDLNQYGRTLQSSYKLNGERGKAGKRDKSVILAQCPLVLIEHGDRAYNLIRWLMDHRGWEFIETLKNLAKYVGMELPEIGSEESQRWIERAERRDILATMQDYFVWCLHNAPSTQDVWQYLDTRFSRAEVETMGLGYIPSQQQLVDYLIGKGFTQQQIDTAILKADNGKPRLRKAIGDSHKIVFPIYRAGSLHSFIFRSAGNPPADLPKYIKISNRNEHEQTNLQFDYIPSRLASKDALVIVEGQADALHLTAAGIKNVVSCGTNNINREAIKDAIRRGARKVVLLLDADPDQEQTHNSRCRAIATILDAVKTMHKEREVWLYVAVLPQQDPSVKVDPSSYLKEYGVERLRSVIDQALKYWQYKLNHIADPYNGKEVTAQLWDDVKADVLDTYDTIADAIDRDRAAQDIAAIFCMQSREMLDTMLVERKAERDKAEREAKIKDLAQQYAAALVEKDTTKADGIQAKIQQLQNAGAVESVYSSIIRPTTREDIVADLQSNPNNLHTGLFLGSQSIDNEIVFPAGALSILAAPTSHGKTTMLLSMAVDAAKMNTAQEFYLFSYEEAKTPITTKALNSYASSRRDGSRGYRLRDIQEYHRNGNWTAEDSLEEYKVYESEYYDMLTRNKLNPIYTDMDCCKLCAIVEKLAKDRPVGGVFIDYIQYLILGDPSVKVWSRAEELQHICRKLKETAVNTGVPIILGAQFSRKVDNPLNIASIYIAEAAEIERIAATILGVWNNDMKPLNIENKERELIGLVGNDTYDPEKKRNSVYVEVLKNRNGAGATAGKHGLLSFYGGSCRVANKANTRTAQKSLK